MVDVEQLVDPELEGLLRELASRPRSVFLRSSRKDAMRVLRSRTTPGVSAMAVSDALERELVTVHRAELAEILKEACRTRLLEGEREKLFMMPYKRKDERHTPTAIVQLHARLDRSVRTETPSLADGLKGVLCDALSPGAFTALPVLDLAALGQRLCPSDTWRLMAAISLIASRMTSSARRLAETVMEGWPNDDDALRALEVAALAECMEGRPHLALDLQDWACSIAGDYPIGAINRLRYALLAVQESRVIDASERLESTLWRDHALVPHTCNANLARRQSGDWVPSHAAVQLAQKLAPRLGPVSREVTRVFK